MIKSIKKNQGGFTLIELMVVIVIIGILVAIALPNFIGAQDRAKLSSIKANMHTVQTMIETYGVDWGGTYPTDVGNLAFEAATNSNPYWKDFTNPFTSKTSNMGIPASVAAAGTATADTFAGAADPNTTVLANKGKVVMETGLADNTIYYIYGADKVGAAIKDKGKALVLTNS